MPLVKFSRWIWESHKHLQCSNYVPWLHTTIFPYCDKNDLMHKVLPSLPPFCRGWHTQPVNCFLPENSLLSLFQVECGEQCCAQYSVNLAPFSVCKFSEQTLASTCLFFIQSYLWIFSRFGFAWIVQELVTVTLLLSMHCWELFLHIWLPNTQRFQYSCINTYDVNIVAQVFTPLACVNVCRNLVKGMKNAVEPNA